MSGHSATQATLLGALTTSGNAAYGFHALENVTSGQGNTGVGNHCGYNITTTNYNTFLGNQADADQPGLVNATAIGARARVTTSNTIKLGDDNVTHVTTTGVISGQAIFYKAAFSAICTSTITSATHGLVAFAEQSGQGFVNSTSTQFTILFPGSYQLQFYSPVHTPNGNNVVAFFKNGEPLSPDFESIFNHFGAYTAQANDVYNLASGDVIEVKCRFSLGGVPANIAGTIQFGTHDGSTFKPGGTLTVVKLN